MGSLSRGGYGGGVQKVAKYAQHSIINSPAYFSRLGKGHAGKLGPSICQAGLMKMEMGFSEFVSSEVTSPAQSKWKEDEAAGKQGSLRGQCQPGLERERSGQQHSPAQ